MDIARPELKQRKHRRQWLIGGVTSVLLAAVGLALAMLGPAVPSVDRNSVFFDTVKRGELLRTVRGPGKLVSKEIRWIAAETDARIDRIVVKPGTPVKTDTVILELSNPEVDDHLFAAKAAVAAAQSELAVKRIDLKSKLWDLHSALAIAKSEYEAARVQEESERYAIEERVIPAVQYKKSLIMLDQRKELLEIEQQRVAEFQHNIAAQLAAGQVRIDQLASARDLRQRQVNALQVRAGIDGMLQQISVEEGQQVAGGSNLARVARPGELMAELRIAETQAKDVALNQAVKIDARNGVVEGRVLRIDPAVKNGTVQVDVELVGTLPAGARPDLSVDGTIEIERLQDVLYVGRPANGPSGADVSLFRLDPASDVAKHVRVRLGRSSVSMIEIQQGLNVGDQVILSDMSAYDQHPRIRLK